MYMLRVDMGGGAALGAAGANCAVSHSVPAVRRASTTLLVCCLNPHFNVDERAM
jgi:hypothetical protein